MYRLHLKHSRVKNLFKFASARMNSVFIVESSLEFYNFNAYDMLPTEKHITGKLYTQYIERENLNLRNRLKRLNRKTLEYTKSAEMHDKMSGTFIEREHYAL